jgi:hypothetical protein
MSACVHMNATLMHFQYHHVCAVSDAAYNMHYSYCIIHLIWHVHSFSMHLCGRPHHRVPEWPCMQCFWFTLHALYLLHACVYLQPAASLHTSSITMWCTHPFWMNAHACMHCITCMFIQLQTAARWGHPITTNSSSSRALTLSVTVQQQQQWQQWW